MRGAPERSGPHWLVVTVCALLGALVGGAVPALADFDAWLVVLLIVAGALIGTLAPIAIAGGWNFVMAPRRALLQLVHEIGEMKALLPSATTGASPTAVRSMSVTEAEELSRVKAVLAQKAMLLTSCPMWPSEAAPPDLEGRIANWENQAREALASRPDFRSHTYAAVPEGDYHPLRLRIEHRAVVLDGAIAFLEGR
jgi:hypothetical protein